MRDADSPIEKKTLERCTIGELLQVLASDAVLPGAGTAAGIALALGAACAGKAVAITRSHLEDDDATSPTLEKLHTQLSALADEALGLARGDALQFKRQLQADDEGKATRDLLATDRRIKEACRTLTALLDDNEALIAGNVKGDWLAARTLCGACREINAANLHALEQAGV